MENELEDLRGLFQHKRVSPELSQKIRGAHTYDGLTKLKRGYVTSVLIFVVTAIVIVLIDRVNSQKMNTSASGFWLLITCALYYAASKMFMLHHLNKIKPENSVLQTIEGLERHKRVNIWMHTYGEILYVLVLSFGVYLYLRPVLDKFLLDHTGRTILCFWWVWGSCILWMLFYTLVVKRRRMRKEVAILEEYICDIKA